MATKRRKTFSQILDETSQECARRHFERAMAAGLLRHQAKAEGNRAARARFAAMKDKGIRHALVLAPDECRVRRATDDPIMLIVSFRGLVALHCPPEALSGPIRGTPPMTDQLVPEVFPKKVS